MEKCWAYEPSDRPTIDEVVDELERITAAAAVEDVVTSETYNNITMDPDPTVKPRVACGSS